MAKPRLRLGKGRTVLTIVLALLLLPIAARIALPHVLLRFANEKLASLPDYQGHIADLDLSLWRGAMTMRGIDLKKKNGKIPVPFVTASVVEGSIEWRALMHGRLVSRIHVDSPEVNVVRGKTKETSQMTLSKEWADTARRYMPIDINRFEAENATLHYRDFSTSPRVDIFLDQGHLVVENLRNVRQVNEERFATVEATGKAQRDADARLHADLDPLAKLPTFNLRAELTGLNMVKLNDFLRAYGNFDVKRGTMSVYTEVRAAEGRFRGYVKPLFNDVQVLQAEDVKKGLGHALWEAIIAGVKQFFENEPQKQVGTEIPLSGRLDQPDVDVWTSMVNLLRNAFIKALSHGLDQPFNPGGSGK